jgi:hypothetical protein
VCFQHQRDFNYLEARHLWEDTQVSVDGVRIAGMHYKALIVEDEPPREARAALQLLNKAGRLIRYSKETIEEELIHKIDHLVPADVRVSPKAPDLRIRHVVKHGIDCYLLFNEGGKDIKVQLDLSAKGRWLLLDTGTGRRHRLDANSAVQLARHEMKVLMVV